MRQKQRQQKNKTDLSDKILLSFLVIIFSFILKELYDIEEVIREWINKPQTIVHTNIGYYKCAGTNKNPKMCPIILKEKFVEE